MEKLFYITCTYEVSGYAYIEASTPEEAEEKFNNKEPFDWEEGDNWKLISHGKAIEC